MTTHYPFFHRRTWGEAFASGLGCVLFILGVLVACAEGRGEFWYLPQILGSILMGVGAVLVWKYGQELYFR